MSRHSLPTPRPATPDIDAVRVGPAATSAPALDDTTARNATGRHAVDPDAPDPAAVRSGSRTSRHAVPPARISPTIPARSAKRGRAALVLVTVAAGLLALPTVSSASVDQCRWQRAAHALLVALNSSQDSRSRQLRDALAQAGVGPRLPAACAQHGRSGSTDPRRTASTSAPAAPATTDPTDEPTASTRSTAATTPPTSSSTRSTTPTSSSTASPSTTISSTTTSSTTTSSSTAPVSSAPTGSGSTAAAAFGWGTPEKTDDFTSGLSGWGLYDGPGNGGDGRRTPSAATVANGILTITGDSDGNSEGMSWGEGRKYGRWEARVRSTPGDENYHPVMLLWPDAENWPVGGEIDWMEISDPSRQTADAFLHYGHDNDQVSGNVDTDATQWHNWAVEWSPHGVTTYLDGKPWWSTKDTSILPPGPMHMTIQLDLFGGSHPKSSQMQVDWVKQYGI